MSLNRTFFFEHVRTRLFPKGMTQSQVEGLNAILDHWEKGYAAKDERWLAYMLATAYHETGQTMQPLRETFAPNDGQAIRRLQRASLSGKRTTGANPYWKPDTDGKSWFGRGLVQLTHKKNYSAMAEALDVDLVGHPELALTMDVALSVMFVGMIEGLFSRQRYRLVDYFDGTMADWINARRIVNGLDRAKDIAGYGRAFYGAIRGA